MDDKDIEPLERLRQSHKYCDIGTFCSAPNLLNIIQSEEDALWTDPTANYYTQSYDNFLISLITVFQALTLENWSDHMFNLHNAGEDITGTIYYLFIVFFGSYFILNLILAVVMSSYIKYQDLFARSSMQTEHHLHEEKKITKIHPMNQSDDENEGADGMHPSSRSHAISSEAHDVSRQVSQDINKNSGRV